MEIQNINNMATSFLATKRGGRKLVCQEYVFRVEKKHANDVTAWKCDCPQKSCRGRAKTNISDEIIFFHKPDHFACPDKIKISEIRTQIRSDAASHETKSNQQIVSDALATVDDSLLAQLPSVHTLKRDSRRAKAEESRKKNSNRR